MEKRKSLNPYEGVLSPEGSPRLKTVLFLTSEVSPYMKTGGLGDFSQAFPPALSRILPEDGLVRVVTTGFQGIEKDSRVALVNAEIPFDTPWGEKRLSIYREKEVSVPSGSGQGVLIDFLVIDDLFDRKGLYGEGGHDYPDNFVRYFSWSLALFVWMKTVRFFPDVMHGNDWQTGMVFPILRNNAVHDRPLARIRSVFTIHNLAFKGLFPLSLFPLTGFPETWANFDALEYYGGLSMIKGGIIFSDLVTTVSPSYRNEVLTEPLGEGLSGALRHRGRRFKGILNGIDLSLWNPSMDTFLQAPFSLDDLSGKEMDRHSLLTRGGFSDPSLPVFACVTRMTAQKGIDLLLEALSLLVGSSSVPFSFFLLGTGDPALEAKALELSCLHPGQIKSVVGFDEVLSHQIYAGSDFFVMPSRYEPCGLAQMYAMRYGSVPLVFPTGGLRDTVEKDVTGLWMDSLSVEGLVRMLVQAVGIFQDKNMYARFRINAMKQKNGWDERSEEYLHSYQELFFSDPRSDQDLLMARMALKM